MNPLEENAVSNKSNSRRSLTYVVLEAFAVFIVHVAVFAFLHGNQGLPLGTDGYYHFTIASQLSFSDLAVDVDSIPFTALGASGTDAHWLIHWLQKPFTLLPGDPISRIHWASLLWASLAPALLCALMRLGGVPLAPVFALLGCWSLYIMPERLLMFRAQNFAVLMLASIALLATQKKLLLFGLAIFLFNHSYQGVILAGVVVAMALVAEALVWRRLNTQLITIAALAFFASIVTSPWFPGNLNYFLVVTLGRLLMPVQDASLMGTEWTSLSLPLALKIGLLAHACLALAITTLVLNRGRIAGDQKSVLPIMFSLLGCAFLVFYLRHWRMGEFYGPFSALALAFTLAWQYPKPKPVQSAVFVAFVLVGLVAHRLALPPKPEYNLETLSPQCRFLQENAESGELVFNTSWHQYSRLLWCAPKLKYIAGLDGLLLAQGDVSIFNQWYFLSNAAIDRIELNKLKQALQRSSSRYMLLHPAPEPLVTYVLENLPGAAIEVASQDGVLISLPVYQGEPR